MQEGAARAGERQLAFMIWTRVFDLLKDLVKYGSYIWLGYWAYLSVEALAGKLTLTDIAISYFTSAENDHGAPWWVALVSLVWALYERRFRLRKTESMSDYIKELEKRLDPKRTSSNLLPTGETNPKDKRL